MFSKIDHFDGKVYQQLKIGVEFNGKYASSVARYVLNVSAMNTFPDLAMYKQQLKTSDSNKHYGFHHG